MVRTMCKPYPSDALEMEEERDTQSLVFGSGALRSSPIYTSTEAKGSPARLPGRLVEPFLEPLRTPLPRSLGRPGPSAACGLEASRGPPGAFEGNRRIGGFCSQNGKIFRQNGS